MSIRLESDSVGSLPVPSDAYYGIQSLQAKENFPISGRAMHPAFLHSLTQIKLAAARANARTGQLPPPIADAICAACGEVMHTLNLGGTAIGSGLNASAAYRRFVYEELCRSAGQGIAVRWRAHPRPRPARRPIRAGDTFPPPEPCHTVRGKSINAPFRTPAR